jgi:hypothetical protein
VLAAAFLLPIVVAACSEAGGSGIHAEWRAEREEVGDTVLIRTVAGSVWGDTMRLVPAVVIGEMDGPDPYVLGNPGSVDMDEEGRIYVADRQAREIRVFGPDGQHRLSFGREGEGPGEFTDPDQIRIASSGEVIVRDQRNARFSVFSREGEFLRSWPLRGGFTTSTGFQMSRDGRVFNPTLRNPGAALSEWRMGVSIVNLEGTSLDTLDVPSLGYETPFVEARSENSWSRTSVPFSPREYWTVLPDGTIIFGLSERYRWERWEPDGTVLAVERLVDGAPVHPGEATGERDRITRNFRRVDPSWRWRNEEIPSVKPAYREIVSGADGSVWLRRHTEAVEEDNPDWDPNLPEGPPRTHWVEPVVYDVFDAEGRYLGPVRFPDGYVSGRKDRLALDGVLTVVTHDFGHEQVVLFHLSPLNGSGRPDD